VLREAVDGHEAAEALGDLVEASPLGVRPGLPEAGDTGVDEARVDLPERLVVDTEAVLDARPEILDQHVGHPREPQDDLAAGRLLHVDGDAALVRMQVLEVGAAAPADAVVVFAGHLHLDDLRAHLGQLADTGRARASAGEIEHADMGQRLHVFTPLWPRPPRPGHRGQQPTKQAADQVTNVWCPMVARGQRPVLPACLTSRASKP
jgi:hypothetical protein